MEVDSKADPAPAAAAESPAQPTKPAEPTKPVEHVKPAEQVKAAEPAEAASATEAAAPTTAQVTRKLRELTLTNSLQQKPAEPASDSPAASAKPETRATPRAASPSPSAASMHSNKRSRTTSERSAASTSSIVTISEDEMPAKKRPNARIEPAAASKEDAWDAYARRRNTGELYHPLSLGPRDPDAPFVYKNHTGYDKRVSLIYKI